MSESKELGELVDEYFPEGDFLTNKTQIMKLINAMLEGFEKGIEKEQTKQGGVCKNCGKPVNVHDEYYEGRYKCYKCGSTEIISELTEQRASDRDKVIEMIIALWEKCDFKLSEQKKIVDGIYKGVE